MTSDRYSYRVIWSEEDGEHVGLCAEFSSLSHLDTSPERALTGIRRLVASVVAQMRRNGETIPDPVATRRFSGRFVVRVTPEVHRRLALEAAESGMSLNQCAAVRLAR